MDASPRIEAALHAALAGWDPASGPPRLAAALRYAVFPGGARIRPRLCWAVAAACGGRPPGRGGCRRRVDRTPALRLARPRRPAVLRRRLHAPRQALRPSRVRRAARRARGRRADRARVRVLARPRACPPERLAPLLRIVSQGVGMPHGIVAGQAWECEPRVVLADYQQAKTGALFAAATMAGAAAAGADAEPWRLLGARLGEAYQVADDLRDVACDPAEIGKPIGRDAALGRPSAAGELGIAGALRAARGPRQGRDRFDSGVSGPGRADRGDAGRDAAAGAEGTRAARRLKVRRRDARARCHADTAGVGVADRWYAWRDRWLGSADFRRWAAAFPLTRPIARRRARAVFDLCAGFVYSQVLLACVRLRLLELLAERPQSLPVIARRTGLPLEGAARLVDAAIALRLVAARGPRPLRPGRTRRDGGRRSGDQGDGRAPRAALRRPARSGGAAARRRQRHRARTVLALRGRGGAGCARAPTGSRTTRR